MFKIDSSGMWPDEASTCMYNIDSYRMQHDEGSTCMAKSTAVVCRMIEQVPASPKLIAGSMTKQVPVSTRLVAVVCCTV